MKIVRERFETTEYSGDNAMYFELFEIHYQNFIIHAT